MQLQTEVPVFLLDVMWASSQILEFPPVFLVTWPPPASEPLESFYLKFLCFPPLPLKLLGLPLAYQSNPGRSDVKVSWLVILIVSAMCCNYIEVLGIQAWNLGGGIFRILPPPRPPDRR